jgi:septal ring factor EnvC (AmiA/AmiB activator)
MMCKHGNRFLLLSLLVFFCYVPAQSQDISPPDDPTPSYNSEQNPSWDSLEGLLQTLKSEATLQSEDLTSLSKALEQSKTEIEELQSSLTQSEQQLANLEQSTKDQAQLYKQLEQRKNLWKYLAIGTSAATITAVIIGAVVWTSQSVH